MTVHAKLSASSAYRWIHCPGSVSLCAKFPDTTSDFAREGSYAHAIAEQKLLAYKGDITKATCTRRINKLTDTREKEKWKKEAMRHTDTYLDYVNQVALSVAVAPFIVAEKRVDFSAYVPEGFGTADCLIFLGDELHVVDFKYGKGVAVSAEDNPQLKLYALGAIHDYALIYGGITKVKLAIVQPRLNTISEWGLTADELRAWGETIKPIAQEAFEGSPTCKAGDWCRFCNAKVECKARAKHYAEVALMPRHDPRLMTNDDLAGYLLITEGMDKWMKEIKELALTKCLNGEDINGYKAVAGRSTRSFTDMDEAFNVLMRHGIDEAILYERTPLTLAKVEKVVGQKEFNALVGDYIIKSEGKPTLVPVTDKREAITNQQAASDVFTIVKGE